MRDRAAFQRAFYRTLTKGEGMLQNVQRLISSRYRRETHNPMLEVIGEMNSISLKRRPQISALTRGRPDTGTILPENLSFVDYVPGDRQHSAFYQSEAGDKAFLTEAPGHAVDLGSVQDGPDGQEQPQHHPPVKEISIRNIQFSNAVPENQGAEHLNDESPIVRSPIMRSFVEGHGPTSAKEALPGTSKKGLPPPMSANQRMKLASARSCFSLAESAIVKKKQLEFSQRGIIYIGDQNYPFPGNSLFAQQGVPETTQISNELVSQAVRTHNVRLASRYSAKSLHLQSASQAKTNSDHPSSASMNKKSDKALPLSDSRVSIDPDDEPAEEEEITTHIKFFEGDDLINSFENKKTLIALQLKEVQSSIHLT